MDGEEGGRDSGVSSQHGDGLGGGVGEELSLGCGEEESRQMGALVGVEEGVEALGEEERRRGAGSRHGWSSRVAEVLEFLPCSCCVVSGFRFVIWCFGYLKQGERNRPARDDERNK